MIGNSPVQPDELVGHELSPTALRVERRACQALENLREANELALDVGADPWAFALPLRDVCNAGINKNDVRWLMGRGFLEQGKRGRHGQWQVCEKQKEVIAESIQIL